MRRPALALLLACLLLVAGVSALDGYDYYQTIGYAACDQEVYQQDIVIHRTTGTAYNETAGGLEIWHIFVGDHCREDYGDIRFTNSTGAELAYYLWPDYDSSSARFTVRLEGADAAGELLVWYGNPGATTTSDGDATYEFFDQFDGDTLGTSWGSTAGSPTVGSGRLRLDAGDGIYSGYQIPAGSLIEVKATTQSTGYDARMICLADTSAHAFVSGGGTSNPGIYAIGVWSPPDGYYEWPGGEVRAYRYAYNTEYVAQMRYKPGGLNRVDYKIGSADWYNKSLTPLVVHPSAYAHGCTIYLHYILIRAYSATPPAAITFSGEQETTSPPTTAFTATPLAGLAPLTVQFTDTSAGRPTSWNWTFGDGGTSTTQNPQHTYAAPGLYTVNLTATNEYGSDTETKTDYITVYGPVTAQFTANVTGGTAPLTVQFTDLSTGGPTAWSWSFGDGNTSAAQNPVHTYTTAGTHTVTLTASHPYDSDTETKTAYITVAVLQPFPGLPLIPRDLTGNGLYTDINGNNRLDYNDLTVFFQHLAWAKTAQPIACFDFNGNGWLDYNDVITLFSIITEEHP